MTELQNDIQDKNNMPPPPPNRRSGGHKYQFLPFWELNSSLLCEILSFLYSRMCCAKFDLNWSNGSREDGFHTLFFDRTYYGIASSICSLFCKSVYPDLVGRTVSSRLFQLGTSDQSDRE